MTFGFSCSTDRATSFCWRGRRSLRYSIFHTYDLPCSSIQIQKDVDSLLAYAGLNGRDRELKEIGGVVGKERSKHQEKRKSSRLLPKNDVNERGQPVSHPFDEWYSSLLTRAAGLFYPLIHAFHRLLPGSHISIGPRYDLQSIIRKADVTSVEYTRLHAKGTTLSSDAGFCIATASSGTFGTRAVILAVGVGSRNFSWVD